MVLKGQAKADYQREYMRNWQRKRRGSKQQGLNTASVLPNIAEVIESMVMPDYGDKFHTDPADIAYIDADGNPVYGD